MPHSSARWGKQAPFPLYIPINEFLRYDNAIRVTYHPQTKKASQTGIVPFAQKSSKSAIEQRITIFNTRSTGTVRNLKVTDRVPISQDERLVVKLIQPPLVVGKEYKGGLRASSGVLVGWDISDEDAVDIVGEKNGAEAGPRVAGPDDPNAGVDGKVCWIVKVPPQKSVSLVLQYEVTSPKNLRVGGL